MRGYTVGALFRLAWSLPLRGWAKDFAAFWDKHYEPIEDEL